jgi:hypothetical protein
VDQLTLARRVYFNRACGSLTFNVIVGPFAVCRSIAQRVLELLHVA